VGKCSSSNESEMSARKTTQADVAARLPLTVPVAAEKIVVRKRPVTTGTVRLRKIVRERSVNVDEPLVHQNVVIERRRVDRLVDTAMPPRREGDILVIPVMEEVLLTRFRVIEEIRIHLRRSVRRQRRTVRLRREDIEIERRDRGLRRTRGANGRDGRAHVPPRIPKGRS